ncbi:head decoration protein [Photobacterium sp. R1]
MTTTETYTPDDFIAGNQPLQTGRAFVAAGQDFPRLTPLMRSGTDATLLVKWDGSAGTAVAMSARPVSSPATDQLTAMYIGGCFRINHVTWPAGVDSDAAKRAAFLGTPISVDDE